MTWLAADEMGIELVRYRKSVVQGEPGLSDQQRLLLSRLAPGAGARPGQAPGGL